MTKRGKAGGRLNPAYTITFQQSTQHQQQRNMASTTPILPVTGKRNILVTSALPYVNNKPRRSLFFIINGFLKLTSV